MFQFYETEGFKLFRCKLDKTPDVPSWQSTMHHIDTDTAERTASNGTYIGAWPPPNYVIIDVDRNHKDKQGNVKPDGMPIFQELCAKLGITEDLTRSTLAVKTGSGGLHLYFTTPPGTDHRTLSPKSIATSVDVRTHGGYVIAAGTNGYSVANTVPPIEIPAPLLKLIQTRNKDKAEDYRPEKELPIEVLQKVLNKIDAINFATNDTWQEFVTSCIAASGNSEEVLDAIEEWSKTDPNYKDDPSVRKRIETFEVAGGITAGTFIYIMRQQGISKYMVDKVRMFIGATFNVSEKYAEASECPFHVDYSKVSENEEFMKAAYYQRNQNAMVRVFVALVAGSLVYSEADRSFYYFDGNRWVYRSSIYDIINAVLVNAGQRWYSDHDGDADADDIITSYIGYLGALAVVQRIESITKGYPGIVHESIEWDSEATEATLTLEDCVMDYSGDRIEFRSGRPEEYRLLYMELRKEDFGNKEIPENFRGFLKDVFPDDDTRKTATYALSIMLSGTGRFRKFQLWNGPGSNGKSTLIEIMKYVIGRRAITYKAEVLLNKNYIQSLTPELAVFRGALAAFASETEESKHISQGVVKTLAGNETVTANPKYKGMIEFKTTFQIVLATNYLPRFSAHDAAFINRVLILPFNTCFFSTEQEKTMGQRRGSKYFVEAKNPTPLIEAIKAERAQILYYLAKRYQEIANGTVITESRECLQAKSHYVDDNNEITQFIEDFVEFDEKPSNGKTCYFTPTKDLVDFYNEENNTRAGTKFVNQRLREVYPMVEPDIKPVDGRRVRGLKHIRIKYGAYPEGWQGNYSPEEIEQLKLEHAEF